ncbi:Ferredoxin-dependent glutamate synthase 1 [Candidatus Venteria ishoeyi]|nr:Ferredoxin-dependent glutamate synthase 1 [Candidatus Venteria ishoeyi]
MVELEPIPEEETEMEKTHQEGDLEMHGRVDILRDMTCGDEARLKKLIENHHRYTNSERAQEILDNWANYREKFIKVMPVDYRRALMQMKQESQSTSASA